MKRQSALQQKIRAHQYFLLPHTGCFICHCKSNTAHHRMGTDKSCVKMRQKGWKKSIRQLGPQSQGWVHVRQLQFVTSAVRAITTGAGNYSQTTNFESPISAFRRSTGYNFHCGLEDHFGRLHLQAGLKSRNKTLPLGSLKSSVCGHQHG